MNKSDNFTNALDYAEQGYEVFPLVPGGKNPLTKNGCNDATTDKSTVLHWIAETPSANIGLKAGTDMLILDIDNKGDKTGSHDLAKIEEELGKLPDCPKVKTPTGGFHLYFSHPGIDVKGQAGVEWNGRKTGIDIRIGNQYIVAPPSIHPDTGTVYQWESPLVPKADLPGLPQTWIDKFLPVRRAVVPKAEPSTDSQGSITETPDTAFPLTIKGTAEQQAVEYLKTCPKAIQGSSGHRTLCSVALALVRGYKLAPQRAADVAWEHYNFYCSPFWTEGERKDFDRKFFEAAKWNSLKPDGWLIKDVGSTDKLAWEPFPVDVFPTSLRNYIVESAKSLNVEPAYIAPFTLAVVASAIGSSIWVQLKPGWKEPSIIWVTLVASSGSGKSPGLDAAVEPLRTAQNKADKNYKRAELEFEEQMTIYKALEGKWKKNPNSMPPDKPAPPIPVAYIADDTTPEALIEILSQNPFGVCLPKDELSGWLGSIGAYGNGKETKEMAFWLAMHGCRSYRVNRKTGMSKVIIASTPAVSVCGGIQPGILRKILNENKHFLDAGLAARILFAMPPDQSQRWSDDFVSDVTKNRYRQVIDRIHFWQSDGEVKPLNPEEPDIISLSEPAQKVFIDFLEENSDEREQVGSDTQKAFFPKLTGYAARIALVFHIVKFFDEDATEYKTIDVATMESAVQLVRWFKRESLRIIEAICGETVQVDFEEAAILRTIRRKGETTAREIVQSGQVYRGPGGTERAVLKMEAMVQNGQLIADVRKAANGVEVTYYSLSSANYANNAYAISDPLEDGVDDGDDGISGFVRAEELIVTLPDEVEEWLDKMVSTEEPIVSVPDEFEAWLAEAAWAEEPAVSLSEEAEEWLTEAAFASERAWHEANGVPYLDE